MVQLPPIPDRIAKLPRDKRGYPVPWFVMWIDGEPKFPIADYRKRAQAVNENLCWVCGDVMGANKAFVIGPMCGVNRTTAEPPAHLECALFSVKACPFLNNPNQKRIPTEGSSPGGIMIERNPGVNLIWVTRQYTLFSPAPKEWLIHIGVPTQIQFWKEGRPATKKEVLAAIEAGCPAVEKIAKKHGEMEEFLAAKNGFLTILNALPAFACNP